MWRIRFWPKKIFSASPSQIFLKRQKNGQIVSKQVKNRSKQVKTFFFKSCAFRHLFSVPHTICCYFLATPATYFAKMAKKSKFHCIWLIFRKIALDQGKKSSATSKMSPMGSFRMFPHHITWKADFWKLSRKPHLEYIHGFLSKLSICFQSRFGYILKETFGTKQWSQSCSEQGRTLFRYSKWVCNYIFYFQRIYYKYLVLKC